MAQKKNCLMDENSLLCMQISFDIKEKDFFPQPAIDGYEEFSCKHFFKAKVSENKSFSYLRAISSIVCCLLMLRGEWRKIFTSK
jgi:hypothetical protein